MKLILIALGGAVGTYARYVTLGLVSRTFGDSFAFGTLFVNVVGSLLICFIMSLALATDSISPTTRIVLTTGMLGGFTTYSTFSHETIELLQSGQVFKALLNIFAMTCVCLLAAWLGIILAKRFSA